MKNFLYCMALVTPFFASAMGRKYPSHEVLIAAGYNPAMIRAIDFNVGSQAIIFPNKKELEKRVRGSGHEDAVKRLDLIALFAEKRKHAPECMAIITKQQTQLLQKKLKQGPPILEDPEVDECDILYTMVPEYTEVIDQSSLLSSAVPKVTFPDIQFLAERIQESGLHELDQNQLRFFSKGSFGLSGVRAVLGDNITDERLFAFIKAAIPNKPHLLKKLFLYMQLLNEESEGGTSSELDSLSEADEE